jgi:hypothetical protein
MDRKLHIQKKKNRLKTGVTTTGIENYIFRKKNSSYSTSYTRFIKCVNHD